MNSSPLAHIRLPPQHLESERALLGAILLRPETLYEIVDLLSSESFYADKHRRIYSAMLELFTRRDPIDLLSLTARLEEKGELAAR